MQINDFLHSGNLVQIPVESKSEDVTKTSFWNDGICWNILKEYDEECLFAKNQHLITMIWVTQWYFNVPMTPYKSL